MGTILISGSGPGQWGDHLRNGLALDFPELTSVSLVSASLDGWAVEVVLPESTDEAAFIDRLKRYLDSDYDPWDVNLVVTNT